MNTYPKEDHRPENGPPSFYQQIKTAAGPEGLPQDFSLQKVQEPEGLHFVDGGTDGIAMFHTSIQPGELGELTEILSLITKGDSRAKERLEVFFRGQKGMAPMLSLVDGLQDWITGHREELDPQRLFDFALHTLWESREVECVKFALSLLELVETEKNQAREAVSTLALSDEFTLFCSYIIRDWSDGSEELFRLAKLVRGWGRIFLLRQLDLEDPRVREWLLWEGWQNDVLVSYTAKLCAGAGGLLELLRRESLTGEELENVKGLMAGLLDEGPVQNISAMEDGPEILREYLRHLAAHGQVDEEARKKLAELTA